MDYLQDSQRRDVHRVLAEQALGRPLPRDAVVHHVDGNKLNNEPSNLVLCPDEAYHRLLHIRQAVIDAGGNPNEERLCCVCKTCKTKDQFHKNNARQEGITNTCKACASARHSKRRSELRSLRELVA
jgi:hypothetical protein